MPHAQFNIVACDITEGGEGKLRLASFHPDWGGQQPWIFWPSCIVAKSPLATSTTDNDSATQTVYNDATMLPPWQEENDVRQSQEGARNSHILSKWRHGRCAHSGE